MKVRLASLAAAALLLSSLMSTPANAQSLSLLQQTFTVTVNDDQDHGGCTARCSLRDAINAANYTPLCGLPGFFVRCRNTINFRIGLPDALTIAVSSPLPTITGSVLIDGDNLPTLVTVILGGQPVTIAFPHPGRVEIAGSLSSNFNGLVLAPGSPALGTIVQNLQVTGFTGNGVQMSGSGNSIINANLANNGGSGVLVQGSGNSIINTNLANNGGSGVSMQSGNNLVRGSTVVNNHVAGISAGNATGNSVLGNTITGNTGDGVVGSGMTVGSTSASDRNVISGNGGCGVSAGSSTILGNYIGVDATGTSAQPNVNGGVCSFASGVTIGGSAPGAGNVISGNGSVTDANDFHGHGIIVDASVGDSPSLVQGNLIGTNAAGTAAIPNAKDGIRVVGNSFGGAPDSLVPSVTILSNVISGNGANGIAMFDGFKHVVQSNFIGTDASRTLSIPNKFNGIFLDDVRSVTVGMPLSGGNPGQANVIAHNFEAGVSVFTATQNSVSSVGNTVRGNSISANTRLGLDLVPNQSELGFGFVTQPLPVHPDTGPNRLQNLPQLTAAVRTTSSSGTAVVVVGNAFSNLAAGSSLLLDVYANSTCDIHGFGEGERFLGTIAAANIPTTVGGGVTGIATFGAALPTSPQLTDGTAITATVTSARGDTSEFSQCLVVDAGTGAPTLSPATATVAPEQELVYTFSWTLPAPRPWRQLASLDLRLRDPDSGKIPLLVRWEESGNTMSLFNEDAGKFGPAGAPGDSTTLANHGARLDLAQAKVSGSGPTGQSVTLTLPIVLNARFSGHTYIVEVAATDKAGQQADFAPAGTLRVTP